MRKLLKYFIKYERLELVEGTIADLIQIITPLATYFQRFTIILPKKNNG